MGMYCLVEYSTALYIVRTTPNYIGGVMVNVLASSVVDRGFETRPGQTKTTKLAFVVFPLSTQHCRVRTRTGWLRIKICPEWSDMSTTRTVVSVS
jgi:hypothetical protein